MILIKIFGGSGLFTPKSYKGKGYFVKIPVGWKILKKKKGAIIPKDVQVVTFVPEETDPKEDDPGTFITIFTKKLSTPVWIEDEFPDILNSIAKAGFKILDKGEIKMDGVFSKWVVYHDEKTPALALEFYMVTDNSVFYKIQYMAPPDTFNALRGSFEELKASFRFRFSLY